jgi:hypothetical protein
MIEIKKYTLEHQKVWDDFIAKSKNATFLFFRDYMDYHADRFNDSSLLILKDSKIIALLPANVVDKTMYSHQGLTYGGLLLSTKSTTTEVLEIFNQICLYLKERNIEKIVYKSIPYIYCKYPAQEDLYAMFLLGAKRIACNISSTILQVNQIAFIESRKSGVRKAKRSELKILKYDKFDLFWEILENNLQEKYSTRPVHTLSEITALQKKFPENIVHYLVCSKDELPLAGTVLYLSDQVAHVQYISSTVYGRNLGALDFLFDYLINDIYRNKTYFDFGQSTEQMGVYLNENLIFQKEGFGGRGVVYEMYEMVLE